MLPKTPETAEPRGGHEPGGRAVSRRVGPITLVRADLRIDPKLRARNDRAGVRHCSSGHESSYLSSIAALFIILYTVSREAAAG